MSAAEETSVLVRRSEMMAGVNILSECGGVELCAGARRESKASN